MLLATATWARRLAAFAALMAVVAATVATPAAAADAAGEAADASAVARTDPAVDGADADPAFGPCQTCVFVVERMKRGTNMLLPAICSEIYQKYPASYNKCQQVLNALAVNGNNVRFWLFEGCYKYEVYQAKEWVRPCPSHIMCSVLKDLSAKPFCPQMKMENPFGE